MKLSSMQLLASESTATTLQIPSAFTTRVPGLASTVKGTRMEIFAEFGHTYQAAPDLPSRLESMMRQKKMR